MEISFFSYSIAVITTIKKDNNLKRYTGKWG